MKKIYAVCALIVLSGIFCSSSAQDPNFAQFFSSPLNINPALTANINADWRIISNFRDQWIGPASPYVTGTISYDRKIMQNKMMNIEEGNRVGIGAMLMYDHAMAGVARNTYASLNFSYNVKLTEEEVVNRVGIGFGAIYGRKYVDFSRLDWGEQFNGHGFDTNLPTGEQALSNMTPYISLSGGLLYTRSTEKSNIDLGVSAFHINTPKQTFLEDENQVVPMRKSIHANFETFLNSYLLLNANAIYQQQSSAYYYSAGATLGYYFSNNPDIILFAGLWYWSNNSIIPYLGIQKNDFQIGLTYDATISKLNEAPRRANSFELSLIIRGQKPVTNKIPCPWK